MRGMVGALPNSDGRPQTDAERRPSVRSGAVHSRRCGSVSRADSPVSGMHLRKGFQPATTDVQGDEAFFLRNCSNLVTMQTSSATQDLLLILLNSCC